MQKSSNIADSDQIQKMSKGIHPLIEGSSTFN